MSGKWRLHLLMIIKCTFIRGLITIQLHFTFKRLEVTHDSCVVKMIAATCVTESTVWAVEEILSAGLALHVTQPNLSCSLSKLLRTCCGNS